MSVAAQIVKRFSAYPPHPLALKNPKGGADGGRGRMGNGDIVAFLNSRPVRMDEALSDGDALCTLANGEHAILKWNNLRPWR